jgi:hypothetical protein
MEVPDMPMTKLTLTADPKLVQAMKKIARKRGTSVSAMFARYAKATIALEKGSSLRIPTEIGPMTLACYGVAKLPKGKTADQVREEAMFEKYGIQK